MQEDEDELQRLRDQEREKEFFFTKVKRGISSFSRSVRNRGLRFIPGMIVSAISTVALVIE